MCPLRFCTFLAVLVSCFVNCSARCSYYENEWHCSEIKSAIQLIGNEKIYSNVTYLAIRNSNITFKENITQYFPNVQRVDLTGSRVNCTRDVLWLLTWREQLIEQKNVSCFGPAMVKMHQALKILDLTSYVELKCPERCNCPFAHIPKDLKSLTSDEPTTAHVIVNCSNLGLVALPGVLPNVTSILLDVSNNKIEDVSELASNDLYSNVQKLNLTNNLVTSVSELEGSKWMSNAKLLNLQGNRLREMPIHVLNSTHNLTDKEGYRFFLANNPWRCDCFTVTNFQKLVAQKMGLINDWKDVTCGSYEGEHAGKRITEIELHEVCNTGDGIMVMAMGGLNVFLAFITALTIGKLLYDFYAYRKTGQLPWLASKLP